MAATLPQDTDGVSDKVQSKENGDLVSIIEAAISSTDEAIILVSKEGKRFSVNLQVAKASSPYFEALVNSEMMESGK
jgi:hypothetical protein